MCMGAWFNLRAFLATTTFTDTAFLLAGSAAAAAVPTLCGSVSGSPVVQLPSDLTAANVRCLVDVMDSYSLAH